jgi:steroid delta-isomerase-like uncharacterized protein
MKLAIPALIATIVVVCITSAKCWAQEEGAMSMENREVLVRRVLTLIDERRLDEAFDLYSADYVYHGPGGQELRGRESIRQLWELFLAGFPDLQSTVDDVITSDDKLVLRWTLRGTHKGEFLGVAPSNKQIVLPIVEIFRIEDGQLVEAWDQYDRLHLLEQIQAAPTPAAVAQ